MSEEEEWPPMYLNEIQQSTLSIKNFFRYLAFLLQDEKEVKPKNLPLKFDDPRVQAAKEEFRESMEEDEQEEESTWVRIQDDSE
jgi:hypothetical protein